MESILNDEKNIERKEMMRIGIAADHGGFALKEQLSVALRAADYEVEDFGAYKLETRDDFPDFVIPLARALAKGDISRGLAICGSGHNLHIKSQFDTLYQHICTKHP